MDVDVLFWATYATPFNGESPRTGALGGSEAEVVWCAEALAARGKRVIVATRDEGASECNGVRYLPAAELGSTWTVKPRALVALRLSELPKIGYDRLLCWATDIPNAAYHPVVDRLVAEQGTLICVSHWQAREFSSRPVQKTVIPNGLPDDVYGRSPLAKVPGTYVYASAAAKGLGATIDQWQRLCSLDARFTELLVCSPGYDSPDLAVGKSNVRVVGGLAFADLCNVVAQAQGLFYVNQVPETFCIMGALAEALGTPAFIAATQGLCGLADSVASPTISRDVAGLLPLVQRGVGQVSAHDFRWSRVVDDWLRVV